MYLVAGGNSVASPGECITTTKKTENPIATTRSVNTLTRVAPARSAFFSTRWMNAQIAIEVNSSLSIAGPGSHHRAYAIVGMLMRALGIHHADFSKHFQNRFATPPHPFATVADCGSALIPSSACRLSDSCEQTPMQWGRAPP